MNHSRSDWYAEIKGNLMSNMHFDEPMKARVLDRVRQQSVRKSTFNKRIRSIITICSVLVLIGIYAGLGNWPQQHGQPGMWGAAKGISLSYQSLESVEQSEQVSIIEVSRSIMQRVPLSSVEVIREYDFVGVGRYFTYKRLHEDSPQYDGLILEEVVDTNPEMLWEYGYGGLTEAELTRSEAFGEFDYRLAGKCGPRIYCTRWFSLDDGRIISELQLNSPAYEHDLDGDGVKEVVLVGTSYFRERIYVLKKHNDQIAYVDLNETLQIQPPDKIIYDHNNQLFQVWEDEELRHIYRYAEGEDTLLPLLRSNANQQ